MTSLIPTLAAVWIALVVLIVLWSKWRVAVRAEYIRNYMFPVGLFEKLRKKRPALTQKDCQLVAQALRQYFLAYLKSGRRFVSMPSQVADDLWHELILYTKAYDKFCQRSFGMFLHHTPAIVLGSAKASNAGLRRCWWYACLEEKINPRKPTRLPLLFALDSKLKIEGGFSYVPDCTGFKQQSGDGGVALYCAGDFSDSTVDGSTDGFGDSASDGGGDTGDGGGCGGGCGGGD